MQEKALFSQKIIDYSIELSQAKKILQEFESNNKTLLIEHSDLKKEFEKQKNKLIELNLECEKLNEMYLKINSELEDIKKVESDTALRLNKVQNLFTNFDPFLKS